VQHTRGVHTIWVLIRNGAEGPFGTFQEHILADTIQNIPFPTVRYILWHPHTKARVARETETQFSLPPIYYTVPPTLSVHQIQCGTADAVKRHVASFKIQKAPAGHILGERKVII
jgi:hypothetical protein